MGQQNLKEDEEGRTGRSIAKAGYTVAGKGAGFSGTITN